jgi:hypothetical protein
MMRQQYVDGASRCTPHAAWLQGVTFNHKYSSSLNTSSTQLEARSHSLNSLRINSSYLFTFVHHFCNYAPVNNILTHTKQFAFHAPITTGVYSVGFDVFRYLSRRRS